MGWVADAILVAAGALTLALVAASIRWLIRDIRETLRPRPTPQQAASQNGRPHPAAELELDWEWPR